MNINVKFNTNDNDDPRERLVFLLIEKSILKTLDELAISCKIHKEDEKNNEDIIINLEGEIL